MAAVTQRYFNGPDAGLRWRQFTSMLFQVSEMEIGEEKQFRGAIRMGQLGSANISRVHSECERARRLAHRSDDGNDEHCVLVKIITGRVMLSQNGETFRLGPGDLAFYSSSKPFEWLHTEPTEVANLTFPVAALRAHLPYLDRHFARAFKVEEGPWGLVSDAMRSAQRRLAVIPDDYAGVFGTHLADLVAMALTASDHSRDDSFRPDKFRTCLDYIRAHVSNPTLDVETVARAVGLSVRSLQRQFQLRGEVVSERIRTSRLDACRAALLNPRNDHLSIGEVAFRNGFRDQSHFSNLFKAYFGVTASALRTVRKNRKDN